MVSVVNSNITSAEVERFSKDVKTVLQQEDSRLSRIVDVNPLDATKTWFPIIDPATFKQKTNRFQAKEYTNSNAESRLALKKDYHYNWAMDQEDIDIIQMTLSPQAAQNTVKAYNRLMDQVIYEALGATVSVRQDTFAGVAEVNNVPFSASSIIAVDDHALDIANGTGNVGLTYYKVAKARTMLQQRYAVDPNEPVFLIASSSQKAEFEKSNYTANGDYSPIKLMSRTGGPSDMAGFQNTDLIIYEKPEDEPGIEYAYMVPKGVIMFNVMRNLSIKTRVLSDYLNEPLAIDADAAIGATRRCEDSIIRINCATTPLTIL